MLRDYPDAKTVARQVVDNLGDRPDAATLVTPLMVALESFKNGPKVLILQILTR